MNSWSAESRFHTHICFAVRLQHWLTRKRAHHCFWLNGGCNLAAKLLNGLLWWGVQGHSKMLCSPKILLLFTPITRELLHSVATHVNTAISPTGLSFIIKEFFFCSASWILTPCFSFPLLSSLFSFLIWHWCRSTSDLVLSYLDFSVVGVYYWNHFQFGPLLYSQGFLKRGNQPRQLGR